MAAVRTHQSLTITIAVTDMPDVTTYSGTAVAPVTAEIEYKWQNPEHRSSWFEPGRASAKVTGLRRLKSGDVGQQEITVDFYSNYGKERPDWLVELIDANLPDGWDK